ncbi:unnamed protein product [Victoria cruziana]
MRFYYVLARWEGSETDSRVLYSALDHISDPFVVPQGKYYLADGGYPNILSFLTPYRGHQYHLSEFNVPGAHTIRTTDELFNHRHSSLRNIVERTFGLLKGRFLILKMQVEYPFNKQVQIVLAACVLHNFIIDHNSNAEQFNEEWRTMNDNISLMISKPESMVFTSQRRSNNPLRSSITQQMYADYENSKSSIAYIFTYV